MLNSCLYWLLSCWTEILCGDPPVIFGATLQGHNEDNSSGIFRFGTVLTYSCSPGLRFDDGYSVRNFSCGFEGQWSDTNVTCDRKTFLSISSLIAIFVIAIIVFTDYFSMVTARPRPCSVFNEPIWSDLSKPLPVWMAVTPLKVDVYGQCNSSVRCKSIKWASSVCKPVTAHAEAHGTYSNQYS